uniref:DNA topoisomerase n=1 Tax=viral metagenome TaxID=1070528 RepID=A0A6C0HZB3_9ZZZZ
MPPKTKFTKKFAQNFVKKTQIPSSASSATYLIIVESPSKCAKIEAFLGKEYSCIASIGHIRNITGLSSIDITNNFAIKFDILPDKKDHVQVLKSTVAKFSKKNIIIATDDDREGEAIAWHICEVCALDPTTTNRILFHEITEPAIKQAISNPTKINMNLVRAAHARQVLDMLVGFKISPLLWKYLYCNKKNSLSAGRCQTPALRLVYDNAKQRTESSATPSYKIIGTFLQQRLPFCLQIDSPNESLTQPQVQRFLENTKTHAHILSVGKSREAYVSAPKPFNTSHLLQTASNRLHMSPKETMSNCQKLYQEGLITYMRTDSTKYSAEFLKEAQEYICKKYGDKAIGDLDKIEQKDATNPHEAIRVTDIEMLTVQIQEPRQLALYQLIWRNTVESCMESAKYEATTLTISAPSINDSVGTVGTMYKHILEIPLFLGWKLVGSASKKGCEFTDTESTHDKDDSIKQMTQEEGRGLLMYLQAINGPVKYEEITATVVMRNMHSHYTEANLIKTLEELGIGRPSTFAFLVETIQERGYVKCQDVKGITQKITEFVLTEQNIRASVKEKTFGEEKKKLVIQPVGTMTVEFLVSHFEELFSYDYTKHMETELDIISSGERTWHELCAKCNDELTKWMKPVAKMKKQVFDVIQDNTSDDKYVVSIGQYGPVLKRVIIDSSGNKQTEYRPIKRAFSLDIDILKEGKYKLEDLMEVNLDLGEYEGFPLLIKEGKYGAYVKWGEKTESLRGISKKLDELERDDILEFLQNKCSIDKKIVSNGTRIINNNLSVRVGKFGPYVFYKTVSMKKPVFYPMKNFPLKYIDCDLQVLLNWINTTHKLDEKIE